MIDEQLNEQLLAYKELAMGVIAQALHDFVFVKNTAYGRMNKESARAFLFGKGLGAYCELPYIDLNADYIRKKTIDREKEHKRSRNNINITEVKP